MRSLPLLLGLVGVAAVAAFSPWTVRAPETSNAKGVHDSVKAVHEDVAGRARLPLLPLCGRLAGVKQEACSMPATQHIKHVDKARRRMQRSVLCNVAAALQLRGAGAQGAPSSHYDILQ